MTRQRRNGADFYAPSRRNTSNAKDGLGETIGLWREIRLPEAAVATTVLAIGTEGAAQLFYLMSAPECALRAALNLADATDRPSKGATTTRKGHLDIFLRQIFR